MAITIQRSFAGGEIGPALYARADQVKYATGLRTCRNFMVEKHGGATNRPGTQFICETKTASDKVRLVKFVFNDEQTYVLEFGDQYVRFIREGVQLTADAAPYEIATPYTAEDVADLAYAQSNDVVVIVHPSYPIHELKRHGETDWSLDAVTMQPPIDAPANVAMDPASSTGDEYPDYVVTAIQDGTLIESLPSLAVKGHYQTSSLSSSAANTVSWDAVTGASEYYVYRAVSGLYGFLFRTPNLSFADQNAYTPDLTRTPPQKRQPFTVAGSYPSSVGFYQQREIFAGTGDDPQKVWMSRTADFHNFSLRSPLQDDDAVTFVIAGRQVNEVRQLIDIGRLIILTAGGEWTVEGGNGGVVTPSAINLRQRGYIGAAKTPALVIGSSVLFIQARGVQVRDMQYDFSTDSYPNTDLTIFANHLFDGYKVDRSWDYQQAPGSVIWTVRSDGTLLGLTYLPVEKIWGWHRHDTVGGAFEEVCCVPEDKEDAAYFVIKRTINGQTVRYIERLVSRLIIDQAADARFVDSHLTYDGRNTDDTLTMTLSGGDAWSSTESLTLTASASFFEVAMVNEIIVLNGTDGKQIRARIAAFTSDTVVTVRPDQDVPASLQATAATDWSRAVSQVAGLDHLEGQTVSVFADANVCPQQKVTDGTITLTAHYSIIHAGLPITADFETLDLENPQGVPFIDRPKAITEVSLLVESSRGIFAGPDADHLIEWKQRSSEPFGTPIDLFTGVVKVKIPSRWNYGGRIFVRQSDPLPLSILAIAPGGAVSGMQRS